MPGCLRAKERDPKRGDTVPQPDDGWREPPGYLGEAVRRAKLISRCARPLPQGTSVH